MASYERSAYVLDELICFLSNPLFQIPVLSFMESNCLIFDPSVEDSPGYKAVHAEYNKLVDMLLEGFRTDTGLTHENIIQAMKTLNSKPDMDNFQVWQILFEQVLATVDYPIFVRIMAQKNLELQQQALLLISHMLGGSLPDSLLNDPSAHSHHHSSDDDQVLIAVLAKSKEEFERGKLQSGDEEEELRIIIGISKAENRRIHESIKSEQEKLHKTLEKSLHLSDDPKEEKITTSKSSSIPPPASYQPKKQTSAPSKQARFDNNNSATNTKVSNVSSAQAAANWMKSAEAEVNTADSHSKAVHAAAASMAGLSVEEYKKREEFLRKQRDRLMEMKQKEREKQLLSAEKLQPERPASARAARAALKQGAAGDKTSAANPEEEKKLLMRKAIAGRIKSELLSKK